LIDRTSQGDEFINLLDHEGEPALEVGIKLSLEAKVDRNMKKRARRCDNDVFRSTLRDDRLDTVENSGEIGAPHTASVDDTQ
jgi:hypothetical protein